MSDVYVGRFNRYFEKLFNIKGGPALVDVESSIRPVVQMSAPPVEERYLVGVESFAAAGAQAAVAANKSAVMIRNPINSGVILVIEKLVCSSTVSEQFNIVVAGSNPADLATSVSSHSRADSRTRSVGTAIVSQDAPAVDPGTGFLNLGLDVGLRVEWMLYSNQQIVLLPQIALRMIGQTVNQNLVWTIFWRERPLETSELT